MSAISELLSSGPENFVQKLFPAGDYLCQIVEAEIKHGYWKPKPPDRPQARWFEVYVPTIEVIDYIPTGDEDIDAQQAEALEKFGDWKGFRPPRGGANSGRYTQWREIPGFEKKVECAGIANGLNYDLVEASPNWEAKTGYANGVARFYNSCNAQGEVGGFVHDVLSTEPDTHTPPITSAIGIGEVIEATKGCYLVVTFIHQQDDPKYEPKLEVESVREV